MKHPAAHRHLQLFGNQEAETIGLVGALCKGPIKPVVPVIPVPEICTEHDDIDPKKKAKSAFASYLEFAKANDHDPYKDDKDFKFLREQMRIARDYGTTENMI